MNINLTLIGQLLAFVVFVWFTQTYVWTPIMAALERRKGKIADGLAAAERGQHEQELAKQRAAEALRNAKSEAAEIVNQAHRRANEIIDEAKGDARLEGERILAAARADIDQEANRAREALREKVSELVLAGAEKIVRRELSADAHRDILDGVTRQI